MVVVMQESDCSRYVRSYSEGKAVQRGKAEGVMMWWKRKQGMGSKTVEGVCFLTNLSLFHEAREGCERRIKRKERGENTKDFLKFFISVKVRVVLRLMTESKYGIEYIDCDDGMEWD